MARLKEKVKTLLLSPQVVMFPQHVSSKASIVLHSIVCVKSDGSSWRNKEK